MPSDQTQAWIAAYTRPRWEKVVASQLLKVGIQSYVPVRQEIRQWTDRKKTSEVPLLPSYVLVQLDPTHYQKVFQADGIVRVITFNRRVAVIRPSEIDLLRRIERTDKPVLFSSSLFRAQEDVRITGGAFAGLCGKVVRTDGTCRVALEIQELSFAFLVEVPCSCVERLSEHLQRVA